MAVVLPQPELAFQDFLLRRSHYLYQLENDAFVRMVKPVQDALPQMKSRLDILVNNASQGFTKEWQIERMGQQVKEMEGMLKAAAMNSAGELKTTLQDLAMLDSDVYAQMLDSKFGKIGIDIVSVPFEQLNFITSYNMRGTPIEDRLLWASDNIIEKMRGELSQSILMGDDIVKATNRLIGPVSQGLPGLALNEVKKKAIMIARTEILHTSNQVARATYNNNQDVLKGLQHSASLDKRTCVECASADGHIFYFENGEIDAPILPLHSNCRCIYIPITKSWSELGERIPEDKVDKAKGFTGNPLEDQLNYDGWLKKQSNSVQEEILGPSRYKLWKSGKIKLDGMVGNNGKLIPVKKLKSISDEMIEEMYKEN